MLDGQRQGGLLTDRVFGVAEQLGEHIVEQGGLEAIEKVNNKKWREFSSEQNQLKPQIEQLGFKYNAVNGSWYLLVDGIESKVFIESYENDDVEDALTPIREALDKVKQINGVTFKWNELSSVSDKETEQVGVLAQDVLEVLPQAVSKNGEYLSVSYGKLVPLLIEAIKEQQKQIDELKRLVK